MININTYINNHKNIFPNNNLNIVDTNDNNILVPSIYNYNYIKKYKYSVKQLMFMLKQYNLKCSGKKIDLQNRIYNYLKLIYIIVKIQKIFRGYIIRYLNSLKGPILFSKNIKNTSVNSSDFLTMELIQDINYYQIFSYKDSDNFIYSFDIQSIYNLYTQNNKDISKVFNPYTRKCIPIYVISNINKIIKISKIYNHNIILELEDVNNNLTQKQQFELKSLAIFQNINNLGNYSDSKWFTSLSITKLLKFTRELIDIWKYRSQLTNDVKREICHPHGNPFIHLNINIFFDGTDIFIIKNTILNVIDNFVNKGINVDRQYLGSTYVLGALTLVSHNASISYPWLFTSFYY